MTWYDQSGNGHDMTQATTARQVRIVNTGTIDVQNTKPAPLFDAVDDRYADSTAGAYAAGAATVLAVANVTGALASPRVIFGESKATTGNQQYHPASFASGTVTERMRIRVLNDAAVALTQTSPADLSAVLHQLSYLDTGSAFATWADGAVALASVAATRTGVVTLDRFNFGANERTNVGESFMSGYVPEAVIWMAALTTGQRQAGEANQKAYFATP